MKLLLKACFASIGPDGSIRAKDLQERDMPYLAEALDGIEIEGVRFLVSWLGDSLEIIMEGEELSQEIRANYIEKLYLPVPQILFKCPEARLTANILNKFLRRANKILGREPCNRREPLPANMVLIRDAEELMTSDIKEAIRAYLKSNRIFDLAGEKQLIEVVQLVAGIPWGEGRTIQEVLITKKVGTCTGKHLVLQACFDELGINYRPVICTFFWGEQKIRYPENLRTILSEGEWEHGHNFVQIKKEGGDYMDVDITWNPKLKLYGFRTFPENWDGKSSFIGLDKIHRRWNGVDMESKKKELIESLELKLRERRELFLREFIKWVESISR